MQKEYPFVWVDALHKKVRNYEGRVLSTIDYTLRSEMGRQKRSVDHPVEALESDTFPIGYIF